MRKDSVIGIINILFRKYLKKHIREKSKKSKGNLRFDFAKSVSSLPIR